MALSLAGRMLGDGKYYLSSRSGLGLGFSWLEMITDHTARRQGTAQAVSDARPLRYKPKPEGAPQTWNAS